MDIAIDQNPAVIGDTVWFECRATGGWDSPLANAEITIWNDSADRLIRGRAMQVDGRTATADTNRHASGQVACQVCHIREYGKGGATEMSRNWLEPHWKPPVSSQSAKSGSLPSDIGIYKCIILKLTDAKSVVRFISFIVRQFPHHVQESDHTISGLS